MKTYPFSAGRPAGRLAAVLGLLALAALPLRAEQFRFKFAEGDSYRFNTVTRESVFLNRELSHEAEITSRVVMDISDVRGAAENATASARIELSMMMSEKNTNHRFTWTGEYKSVFRRDELGHFDIAPEYFMPVTRDHPVFPEYDVKPGESWTAPGEDAYDLRENFGIAEPFRVPFTANYTYKGKATRDGKEYDLIHVEYTIMFDNPPPARVTTPQSSHALASPVTTMESFKQDLYWDNDRGVLQAYDENFRIMFQLASGDMIEYRGGSTLTVTEVTQINRADAVKAMNGEIKKLGIADTNAKETDEGITISLENIQFEADSANLLPSEKEKIQKIASLLERYPDKELLISGHTARAGTPSSRQKLSEERAEAVARLLVEMGVRSEYNVYTRGFGAEKPIAPNDTEANKSRNRRVEITILDK